MFSQCKHFSSAKQTNLMQPEPTLIEKIAALPCLQELEGAEEQIRRDGRMTSEVQAAIATRRAELLRHKTRE